MILREELPTWRTYGRNCKRSYLQGGQSTTGGRSLNLELHRPSVMFIGQPFSFPLHCSTPVLLSGRHNGLINVPVIVGNLSPWQPVRNVSVYSPESSPEKARCSMLCWRQFCRQAQGGCRIASKVSGPLSSMFTRHCSSYLQNIVPRVWCLHLSLCRCLGFSHCSVHFERPRLILVIFSSKSSLLFFSCRKLCIDTVSTPC